MNEPTEESTAECLTSSKRKLSNFEVADFIVEKGIKSETELLGIANEQKKEKKKTSQILCYRELQNVSTILSNKHGR